VGILITGGTGAFGHAFVRYMLDNDLDERICIYSRDEVKQAQMRSEFPDDRMRWFVGDVRDKTRLRRAMSGIDTVIHAAALKRIEVGYYAPEEIVHTNIIGSMYVIDAAYDSGVDRVVALSTDKAHAPCSPYGQSKAIMESLFLSANRTHHGPMYSCVRYGNIWKSRGSVVPTWQSMKDAGHETVPVTDPDCTRFFMWQQEAIDLVLETLETMPETLVIKRNLPAYRIGDLVEAMGMFPTIRGLPEWEKMHECLAPGYCSGEARRMTILELQEALNRV